MFLRDYVVSLFRVLRVSVVSSYNNSEKLCEFFVTLIDNHYQSAKIKRYETT